MGAVAAEPLPVHQLLTREEEKEGGEEEEPELGQGSRQVSIREEPPPPVEAVKVVQRFASRTSRCASGCGNGAVAVVEALAGGFSGLPTADNTVASCSGEHHVHRVTQKRKTPYPLCMNTTFHVHDSLPLSLAQSRREGDVP